jgi:ribosomal protein S9
LPVYDKLETALSEVHEGGLKPQQASAMAALARAMVSVLTSGELEERLRDIESKLRGKTQ